MVCSVLLLIRQTVVGPYVLMHVTVDSSSCFVTLIVNSNSGGSCGGQVVVVMDLYLGEWL